MLLTEVELEVTIFSTFCTFTNQGIYNFSKKNPLCFGEISRFPVFSLTENFLLPRILNLPAQHITLLTNEVIFETLT